MSLDQTASIHAAITLGTTAQDVTTAITAPNTARALSVTGTKAGATLPGTVTLTGTDEYGQTVTETYALDGNNTVYGPQVFATVTTIALPARVTSGDTVKVGYQDRLFSLADARAYASGRLSNSTTYTDATILAAERLIRTELERICEVAFLPVLHREYVDGDGSCELLVSKAMPLAVTACVAYNSEQTASETFDTDDISDIAVDEATGLLTRRSHGTWLTGHKNILITYLHGHRSVPDVVKDAALRWLVTDLPTTNVPMTAESYDEGGMTVTFASGDGFNGAWHRIPEVRRAIRLYSLALPGIA